MEIRRQTKKKKKKIEMRKENTRGLEKERVYELKGAGLIEVRG